MLSKVTKAAQREKARLGSTDGLDYVYRCHACGRLITKIEILEQREEHRATICPCGSKAIRTTKAKIWEELLLPRCWRLIYAIYTKQLAPVPLPLTPEETAEKNRVGREKNRAFDKMLSQMLRKKGVV